jgi:hypothetical protein
LGRRAEASGISFRKPIHETENYRGSIVAGTGLGVCNWWYLGNRFAARLDLGYSFSPIRVSLDWYAIEDIQFSTGIDPLWGSHSWEFWWIPETLEKR